jgi:hypothetical protein
MIELPGYLGKYQGAACHHEVHHAAGRTCPDPQPLAQTQTGGQSLSSSLMSSPVCQHIPTLLQTRNVQDLTLPVIFGCSPLVYAIGDIYEPRGTQLDVEHPTAQRAVANVCQRVPTCAELGICTLLLPLSWPWSPSIFGVGEPRPEQSWQPGVKLSRLETQA